LIACREKWKKEVGLRKDHASSDLPHGEGGEPEKKEPRRLLDTVSSLSTNWKKEKGGARGMASQNETKMGSYPLLPQS